MLRCARGKGVGGLEDAVDKLLGAGAAAGLAAALERAVDHELLAPLLFAVSHGSEMPSVKVSSTSPGTSAISACSKAASGSRPTTVPVVSSAAAWPSRRTTGGV